MRKICEQCGLEYYCRPCRVEIARFCSIKCKVEWERINGRIVLSEKESRKKYKRPEKKYVCLECGKEFIARGYKKRRYCNRECGGRGIGKLTKIIKY